MALRKHVLERGVGPELEGAVHTRDVERRGCRIHQKLGHHGYATWLDWIRCAKRFHDRQQGLPRRRDLIVQERNRGGQPVALLCIDLSDEPLDGYREAVAAAASDQLL